MTSKRLKIETRDHDYDLLIGTGVSNQFASELQSLGITAKTKILLITDHHVAPYYLEPVKKVLSEFQLFEYIVQAGESAKSLEQVDSIITYMIQHGFDRTSYILALGGGVIGDLSGFVASIYMRGIRFIQCPTTILAHDSSIGGKVGINHPLGKNLIGAFHQPSFILYDTQFLKTLPAKEIRSGLAEVVKHGLIADSSFTHWLNQHAESLLNLDFEALNEALYQGSRIKATIVKEDEKEQGIRAYLNFGHTLAHAIETVSHYDYSHGEAVAIGMVFATRLSERIGYISRKIEDYYLKLIERFQLPTSIPKAYNTEEILQILMRDKKFKQSQIRMVLPIEIGKVMIVEGIEIDLLRKIIEEMKA
ncbi:3-dehydroquinate synthase [Tepidibacillus fermentans]|uniref:3-dehydroquinate synthase n=1 Tax=Tepidibacillus fermentans TaxID=1281767 RepID=A0A4R3KMI0_9BACI|nr:3-dehydroquinate synthase [Tepidibacillus fermentans]TCS84148.1 3-dehydroquinate synthase [Tepidibacillus fermentans]